MPRSAANVVREVFAAVNRGDAEAASALVAEDAEIFPIRSQLEGTAYRGPDGLRKALAAAMSDWSELQFAVDEVRELPGGLVALARFQARGAASGVDLDVPTGWHFRVSGEKISYARAYSKSEDALGAASAPQLGGEERG